jgi:hypothetical protein
MLIFLASAVFNACEDKDFPFGPVLETSLATVNFGTEAGEKYIMVNSNRAFTVAVSKEWCKAEIISGELDNLKITVDRNTEVGKTRTSEIIVSSDGLEDRKVTVVQEGVTPVIITTEKILNLKTESEFTLEIEANLLFKYELPEWIHAAANNHPTTGKQTYYFTLDPLPEGEIFRSGNVVVKAADSEIAASATMIVKQGEEIIENNGANKANPYIAEAESCLEGLEAKYQDWWAQSGEALGDNYYVNAYNRSISYQLKVIDGGIYDFSFTQVSWGGGSLKLYIDDVEIGNATIPNYPGTGGPADIIIIESVTLTEGEHIVKAQFTGNSDFDKFTVVYNPYALVRQSEPCIIEAESSVEGLEAKYQDWWAQSGEALGDNYYVNAYNNSISYQIKVIDAGSYNFNIKQVSWGGGSLKLYIDNVEAGNATIPNYPAAGPADIIVIESIALTVGEHIVKLQFTGSSDFDKFTIIYNGN